MVDGWNIQTEDVGIRERKIDSLVHINNMKYITKKKCEIFNPFGILRSIKYLWTISINIIFNNTVLVGLRSSIMPSGSI